MMFLKPDGKIDLDHRAYHLRSTPNGSLVIAAAKDGEFSVLIPELKEVHLRRLPSEVRAVAPHPSDRRLAWVDDKSGSLIVQSFDGSWLLEIGPPQVKETTPEWVQRGFHECLYCEDGRYLWTVAQLSSEEVMVQLHEAETGATIDRAILQDPFGGSSCSFYHTGRAGLTSLWLAAGQDGQQVYWLNRTRSGFSCTLEAKLRNTIPPVFSPSGDEFLMVNEDHAICKFDFPSMQQVGLPLQSRDEDNPFAESLCYLTNRQALASTNEQRIFVVDTVQVKVEAEVSLEGHEPRPIGEYYPRLVKETRLGTDISSIFRLGDVLMFVYRRDRATGLECWKDTLLWLSVKGRE